MFVAIAIHVNIFWFYFYGDSAYYYIAFVTTDFQLSLRVSETWTFKLLINDDFCIQLKFNLAHLKNILTEPITRVYVKILYIKINNLILYLFSKTHLFCRNDVGPIEHFEEKPIWRLRAGVIRLVWRLAMTCPIKNFQNNIKYAIHAHWYG